MSTVGFREAFDNSLEVRIADDLTVRVASLPGLALMKIVAWAERRFARDAQDFGMIMRHYLDAGNQDRVYREQGDCFDLLTEDFDYQKTSARILGRDVGVLLTEASRRITERVLSNEVARDGLEDFAAAIRNNNDYHGNYDVALEMLAELRTGISEGAAQ